MSPSSIARPPVISFIRGFLNKSSCSMLAVVIILPSPKCLFFFFPTPFEFSPHFFLDIASLFGTPLTFSGSIRLEADHPTFFFTLCLTLLYGYMITGVSGAHSAVCFFCGGNPDFNRAFLLIPSSCSGYCFHLFFCVRTNFPFFRAGID